MQAYYLSRGVATQFENYRSQGPYAKMVLILLSKFKMLQTLCLADGFQVVTNTWNLARHLHKQVGSQWASEWCSIANDLALNQHRIFHWELSSLYGNAFKFYSTHFVCVTRQSADPPSDLIADKNHCLNLIINLMKRSSRETVFSLGDRSSLNAKPHVLAEILLRRRH